MPELHEFQREDVVLPPDLQSGFTSRDAVRLHYMAAGRGRPVILLHGFPDFWYGWRRQLGPLVQRGYRVIAPDLRGYNLSEKPTGLTWYDINELAADVLRLASELCPGEQFDLIGHDWGAAIAWWLGIHHPERLKRLVIVNVPHPTVFERALHRPAQMLKSWYILFFQLPGLPEWVLGRNSNDALIRLLRVSSRRSAFSESELDQYRTAWNQPGALTAMLNWYRAVVRHRPRVRCSPRVTVPTLVLWGAQDVALGRGMAEASRAYCADGRLVIFEQASHWPHLEEWTQVNGLILRFLDGGTAALDAGTR